MRLIRFFATLDSFSSYSSKESHPVRLITVRIAVATFPPSIGHILVEAPQGLVVQVRNQRSDEVND
jgi:hypothetical protein